MRHRVEGADSLDGMEAGTEREIAGFVTSAMAEAATDLKEDWRDQIVKARLGKRLANSVRSEVYPKGQPSVDAAAYVWTRAGKIIGAYAEGTVIVARNARWLAIPTWDVPMKRQGNRLTPEEVEAKFGRQLRFVDARERVSSPSFRRNGIAYLILPGLRSHKATGRWRNASASEIKRGKETSTAIMFTLVPLVRVAKRGELDLDALGTAADVRWPGLLSKAWR